MRKARYVHLVLHLLGGWPNEHMEVAVSLALETNAKCSRHAPPHIFRHLWRANVGASGKPNLKCLISSSSKKIWACWVRRKNHGRTSISIISTLVLRIWDTHTPCKSLYLDQSASIKTSNTYQKGGKSCRRRECWSRVPADTAAHRTNGGRNARSQATKLTLATRGWDSS